MQWNPTAILWMMSLCRMTVVRVNPPVVHLRPHRTTVSKHPTWKTFAAENGDSFALLWKGHRHLHFLHHYHDSQVRPAVTTVQHAGLRCLRVMIAIAYELSVVLLRVHRRQGFWKLYFIFGIYKFFPKNKYALFNHNVKYIFAEQHLPETLFDSFIWRNKLFFQRVVF